MTRVPVAKETILLVGGGTGGHVFPLIAVADELQRIHPPVRLVFVGTERGIESQVVPERGYELELMQVEPIRGRGVWGALRGGLRAAATLPQARALLQRYSPKVVFSIGGYAAGPISLLSRTLGVPLALMEPNGVIGFANRVVAPLVQRAYTSFPDVERSFPRGTVLRTGLAIRRGFEPVDLTEPNDPLRVLVLGGSQGALALNDAVPKALARVPGRWSVVHQAGKGHDAHVRELYRALVIGAERVEVLPFIGDMPAALAAADLVISRSGAGATAEICAVGRPALFIPYPFAAGNHQLKNARALERAGAAVCISASEASPERLTREISALVGDRARLVRMARTAQGLGRPDAAEVVARDLLALGNVQPGEGRDSDSDLNPAPGDCSPAPSEVH